MILTKRVENFMIQASGSDKQMLCGSSRACASLDFISVKQHPKKVGVSFVV